MGGMAERARWNVLDKHLVFKNVVDLFVDD